MKIKISLEYFAPLGEDIVLSVKGLQPMKMRRAQEGRWEAAFGWEGRELSYGFTLRRGEELLREEWRGHSLEIPSQLASAEELELLDRWQDRPEDSQFWSKAFSEVIFAAKRPGARSGGGSAMLLAGCATLRPGESLALCGSGKLFADWSRPSPMRKAKDAPLWSLCFSPKQGFEYKFVIINSEKEILAWETGGNRRFERIPEPGKAVLERVSEPRFDRPRWRGAGVAVPVFSLRSEDSFGVGEFADIKKLADWAAAAGQSFIQLLPVNDSTMSGTWTDSYPYNANSSFALHPMYINLPAAGVRKDKAYRALKAELEALPAVDYERVNSGKLRLLRKLFEASRAKLRLDSAYKAFCKENEAWLLPYAVFCAARERFGTVLFSKWGKLASYSPKAALAYQKAHKDEVEFHFYLQYLLDKQLSEAVQYAHSKGVAIKGDLPIGVSRTSADAWSRPELFNLDSQAGAPPDAFSAEGQNWGFPTYNWEEMAKDGYAWWKARLKKMSEYFDAFRIDHILGFFRIWEIPLGESSGLLGHFSPALSYSAEELAASGFEPGSGLFLPDPRQRGHWQPRISTAGVKAFEALPSWLQGRYNALREDFYYHRNEECWKASALRKLPSLLSATAMLACGEDLGMIPACVPSVMSQLGILSLEIQRMPKDPQAEFGDPASYPYLSVCATGTHDTSTLRGWWEEDREQSNRFYHNVLHRQGQAPFFCEPWLCEDIVSRHLQSPSMLCILPLQDWLSISGSARYGGSPSEERINVPANPRHYWRWRMHLTLEELLSRSPLTARLRELVQASGRG